MTSQINEQEIPRANRMKGWMRERNITYVSIAERVGMSGPGMHHALNREGMNMVLWQKLVDLGMPADILPKPYEKAPRKNAKERMFPNREASA